MPATYTYPGVYVEEVPSGVRTIAGVSTSDTAYVDFFARGPVNEATRITSFGDFERQFGGLDDRSEASYALQQFYLNGGAVAWVVRVTSGRADTSSAVLESSTASPPQGSLTVAAANPGKWGDNVQVAALRVRKADGTFETDKFNLAVREVRRAPNGDLSDPEARRKANEKAQVVATEIFRNLNLTVGDPLSAKTVVNDGSALVRITDVHMGGLPTLSDPNIAGDAPDDFVAWLDLRNGSDGDTPVAGADLVGDPDDKTGIYALDRIAPSIFNILCVPAATKLVPAGGKSVGPMQSLLADAEAYCVDKRAFLIVDIPPGVQTVADMRSFVADLEGAGLRSTNAAVYFPRLTIPDRLQNDRPRNVGASGTLAGVYSRTDATRGVWKTPAGTEAFLRNARLTVKLGDLENGALNPLGVNALRTFPIVGTVSWGGRTLEGADQLASEWKYVAVRRTALYIEESLYEGLQWVVFEPNDEPLWAQVRMNVGAFMHDLFRQGAFQGNSPDKAYFVKCDDETTTQNDVDRGIVNIWVGFAPLKPAEFVVLKIQQMAGQVET
jgi:phage tail sheath protein FI